MTENDRGAESPGSPLAEWTKGRVWFRPLISDEVPWGREDLLEAVPAAAVGSYGVRMGAYGRLDGRRYQPGEVVMVASREELAQLLSRLDGVSHVIFPWFDRMVPVDLLSPWRKQIDLNSHRAEAGSRLFRSLGLSAALVGLGFYVPLPLRMVTLIMAAIYGLFPLVDAAMTWTRRLDRLSVEELNRRLVNFELFRRWLLGKRSRLLQVGVGVLVACFVAQVVVGQRASIEAAALVKERVRVSGEWWRLVTTGLLHANIVHILFNGMALRSLGRVIVALVSPSLLGIVFLVTVVTGSLASLYLGGDLPSVGASGGILGCVGFLIVVTVKFREFLPGFLRSSLIQSSLVMALFGFLGSDFIDNAAHGGGFVGGMVLGGILWPWLRLAPTETRPPTRFFSALSLILLALAAAKVGWELWRVAAGGA